MNDPSDTLTGIERLEDEFPEGQVLTPTRVRRAFMRTWREERALERRIQLLEDALRLVVDRDLPSYAKSQALATLRHLVEEEIKRRKLIQRWVWGALGAIALKVLETAIEKLVK